MVTVTSPYGQVSDHSTDPTHMNAQLFDFDVDGTTLKDKHLTWLDDAIDRINANDRSLIWNISATGSASLTGMQIDHNKHNYDLGFARAQAVETYLKAGLKVPGLVFDPPFSAGTMFASWAQHKVGVENDADRCAFVVITTDTDPPPPPRKKTSIPLSRTWGIRYVWGDALTMVVGLDAAKYDIADLTNHLHATFEYSGDVIAGSVYNFPLSITGGGSWYSFSTSDAIHISDFDGPARFTTAGALKLSKNYLRLTPKGGATTIPNPLDIPTGTTYGVPGASATIPKTGWLRMKSDATSYSGHFPPGG
jgi:hypothetical protein